jgi:solute carrier family 35 protein C2
MAKSTMLIRLLPGIALFTYHKYRKSIDSPVPLDAHGNPLTDEEAAGLRSGALELSETEHLAARMSTEEFDRVSRACSSHSMRRKC